MNSITENDRKLAEICLNCTICKRARKNQKGFLFWFVNKIEQKICPPCRSYKKVYGRYPHERLK